VLKKKPISLLNLSCFFAVLLELYLVCVFSCRPICFVNISHATGCENCLQYDTIEEFNVYFKLQYSTSTSGVTMGWLLRLVTGGSRW